MKKDSQFSYFVFSKKKIEHVFPPPKRIFIKLEELEKFYSLQLENKEKEIIILQEEKKDVEAERLALAAKI